MVHSSKENGVDTGYVDLDMERASVLRRWCDGYSTHHLLPGDSSPERQLERSIAGLDSRLCLSLPRSLPSRPEYVLVLR